MVKVSGLFVYPVKSLAGISLETSMVDDRGLRYDRRLMLVDSEGMFITQRKYPKLTLLSTQLEGGMLTISDGMDTSIEMDLGQQGDAIEVQVWKDRVKGSKLSNEYDAFFSDYLETEVMLVSMTDFSHRLASNGQGQVSFADGYPHLLISEASLAALNERLDTPVGMNRFRPNIVLEGLDAHEEDRLQNIEIGTAALSVTTPCARCVMTTIDPTSGEPGGEPLKTLSGYRQTGNKVNFGVNAITIRQGELSVGDKVLADHM